MFGGENWEEDTHTEFRPYYRRRGNFRGNFSRRVQRGAPSFTTDTFGRSPSASDEKEIKFKIPTLICEKKLLYGLIIIGITLATEVLTGIALSQKYL